VRSNHGHLAHLFWSYVYISTQIRRIPGVEMARKPSRKYSKVAEQEERRRDSNIYESNPLPEEISTYGEEEEQGQGQGQP